MSRVKHITHTDLDGAGCQILTMLAFGRFNVDVQNCNYNNIDEVVSQFIIDKEYENYEKLFITDIRVNEVNADMLDCLHKDGQIEVILLDHHQNALYLNQYDWGCVKMDQEVGEETEQTCGTSMTYSYLTQNSMLTECRSIFKFTEIVRKYDTWLWKNKYDDTFPASVSSLMYLLGLDNFVDNVVAQLANSEDFTISSENEYLLEVTEANKLSYAEGLNKHLQVCMIQGKQAGVIYSDGDSSQIGNVLSVLSPDLDFIMVIDMNRRNVSLRTTRTDINLGLDVATHYNGGGHAQAAGCDLTPELFATIIQQSV